MDFVLTVDSSHLCIAHLNRICSATSLKESNHPSHWKDQITFCCHRALSLGTCYPILDGGTSFHIMKLVAKKKNTSSPYHLPPNTHPRPNQLPKRAKSREPKTRCRRRWRELHPTYVWDKVQGHLSATEKLPVQWIGSQKQTTEPLQTGWLLAKLQSHHALYWSFLVTGTTKGKAKTSYRF